MKTVSAFRRILGRVLGPLLTALGWPMWRLYRALGVPRAPAGVPAPTRPQPGEAPHLVLPEGWTRPREMPELRPTLAPVTLAFGLGVLGLSVLVGGVVVTVLGGVLALLGAGLWAWEAWQETA